MSERYYRKVIKIRGIDSPNVQFGMAQERLGLKADGLDEHGQTPIPGVLSYEEYVYRRRTWDKKRQCVGLDAEFYEGADELMFPPLWLNRCMDIAANLDREVLGGRVRIAKCIGIDPAEGGDKTAMCAVDEFGLIEMVSKKTPNTAVITGEAIAFGRKHMVPPENWIWDRGGGGKQHADRLREDGYNVRTIAFGESVAPELKPGSAVVPYVIKLDQREDRYVYKNRRAEMYHTLRLLIDPAYGRGFAIPQRYLHGMDDKDSNLWGQLKPIPLRTDGEGRIVLPPKTKKANSTEECLIDLIGHSPDEADALVLAVHGLTHEVRRIVAGSMW